ncbi:DUF7689 domain-containing protein [Leptospira noguchii]|uniref:DUF7689 domain-containing protein n=1 Tax=Leptospira noguchii serovar Autumnalis str. ZUN142 TaxID=1085540 RepID=M6U887_9LEPT|nr:hypothetical protein [Leptospira noguchii]EMO41242.1 hypothetical protein LEP1GSC186_2944 [Leptospira noguchii serovar Autumnalis str. ZUN142]UOG49299.1 hypothetical protein MAL00_03065 [Leptospira noguchii]
MDSFLHDWFPKLKNFKYKETSKATISYNCFAWAAGIDNVNWDPDSHASNRKSLLYTLSNLPSYWPADAPAKQDVESFLAAYHLIGFTEEADESLEAGFYKIAIYASDGIPTHAARQLSDGTWTSKLGRSIDIMHEKLEALESIRYGSVAKILKKQNR